MLELVNLSNSKSDVDIIGNGAGLQAFLNHHNLDGIEMMFVAPWDDQVYKKDWIHGVHLMFWPCWLDFWQGNQEELLIQFGSKEKIKAYYGVQTKEDWLDTYRANINIAKQAGAKYIVFHVSHARTAELFNWRFSASDREVIEAVIQVVNELADEIPTEMTLLFENLWWPGLNLKNKELTAMLLENVKHSNVGIMLDTGHLMNTNIHLKTETEGVDYILQTLSQLGKYRHFIRGIHLHRSLSGQYISDYLKTEKNNVRYDYSQAEVISHVLKMDEHLPFTTCEVQRVVDYINPDYLVHEFVQMSQADWAQKVSRQQQALQFGRKPYP